MFEESLRTSPIESTPYSWLASRMVRRPTFHLPPSQSILSSGLTTPSSSLGLVQEAHKTAPLVPAKADALVCKWLDTKERIHLHRAMAKTVSVEALEPWIERCAKAIRSNPPPIQTARVRWELQQPFSHPIVQSLFDLNPKASDEDDIVALIPVLAGMHAIGADAAMALVDLADPFWNKKTVLRGLAPHLSPTEKNVILARASFTQKSWTAEALGLPKP